MLLSVILLIASAVSFGLGALNVAARINWLCAGLFFLVCAALAGDFHVVLG